MGLRKVKLVDRDAVLPNESGTGAELKQALGIGQDRLLAMRTPTGLKEIGNSERVDVPEGAELVDIPFHEYGLDVRVGMRLKEECHYLGGRYGQNVSCGYDQTIRRWWVRFPQFPLPAGWSQRQTALIVTVTDQYPSVPPDGFLLSAALTDRHGRPPDHYYGYSGHSQQLTALGYGWFCLHPRGWKGELVYRDGDSVAKYVSLIEIALAKVVR